MRRPLTLLIVLFAFFAAIIPQLVSANAPDYYVTVKMGDTLYAIAARYGISVEALMAANKLANADAVYVGQRLVITNHALPSASAQTPAGSVEYVVRPGDTLYSIAVSYNTTVTELARANNLASMSVYSGQRLRVPNALGAANPAPPRPATALPVTRVAYNDPNGAPMPLAPAATNPPTTDRWIDVNLTDQTVTAYQGTVPLKTVRVSTGLPRTPTVVGQFKIYRKLTAQTMWGGSQAAGDYYYLPNVPNVMYFYQGYALHGTYWHSNFGRPMSHGCVNLTLADAKWFFDWASVGTIVVTHK